MLSINDGESDVEREAPPSTSILQGASNLTIYNSAPARLYETHGSTIIYNNHQSRDQQNSIMNLPRAEAVFNDYRVKKKSGPCFEGTRVALLTELADWVTDSEESRMYILSGLAGSGKSTIAYSIASRAADLDLLGASFFFTRDEVDRNNAKRFFTTIAYQLCVYDGTFANAIGDALQTYRGSAAITKDPKEQLQTLILDPLRSVIWSRTQPILVVVDAFDECDEDDGYAVISGLSQLVQDLPPFKVILTTRPTPQLSLSLDNRNGHRLFHLQDIDDNVVDSDIRLYLRYCLSLEQVQKRFVESKWCASDKEIDYLVHAAGRRFILASTAVQHILDRSTSNPAAQMQKLLRAFDENRTPFEKFDYLYMELMADLLIEHAVRLTKRPICLGTDHFAPKFSKLIHFNPQAIELNVRNLDRTLHPLLDILDKLLEPSNIHILQDGYCQECRFFQITHDILTHFKPILEGADRDVEKCLDSMEEIIRYGDRQQHFDMNFGRHVFGSAAIVGLVMAILAHRR